MTTPNRQMKKLIAGTYLGGKEQGAYDEKLHSILSEFEVEIDKALATLAEIPQDRPQVQVIIARWEKLKLMLDGCASFQEVKE
jgi:hypothetical protein